jgi:subtilisin-like proprotein convertase family protein
MQPYTGPTGGYLALDELAVQADPSASLKGTGVVATAAGSNGWTRVQLSAVKSSRDLGSAAQKLALELKAPVRAVIYSSNRQPRAEQKPSFLAASILVTGSLSAGALSAAANGAPVTADPNLPGALVVSASDPIAAIALAEQLAALPGVDVAEPQVYRPRTKRLVPNDPIYPSQWHLNNEAQTFDGVAGIDVRAENVWSIATGSGVRIAIVDDGVQLNHPDLVANLRTDLGRDIIGNDADPTPGAQDFHGTSCAGIAAAVGNNNLGVAGMAYEASIVPVRLTVGDTTDAQEAAGIPRGALASTANNRTDISSNSWGPFDTGTVYETWGTQTATQIQNAITSGRGGLGTIFVWAAGNGRENDDNVNRDGYASSRYTIAVGAHGADGTVSYYSEPGASMMVSVPSNYRSRGESVGTTTTDITGTSGYSTTDYTDDFGGTSSAAPLVAGIVAVILQAKPGLTWRDVQHVLVYGARQIDSADEGWLENGAGLRFNHNYGFGLADAYRSVFLAQQWTNVPANATPLAATLSTSVAIPDGSSVERSFTISGAADFFVEHVELRTNITHTYRGDIEIILTSPAGTQSILATSNGDSGSNIPNWTFTSVAHWGENPNGQWTLRVADLVSGDTGSFNNTTLTIRGFAKGTWAPAPLPANTPASPATATEPVLHVSLSEPGSDFDGDPVSYRYTWSSTGGDTPVVITTLDKDVTLKNGTGGATLNEGETWTVNVETLSEGESVGSLQSGSFIIGPNGSVNFSGWRLN